MCTHMCDKLSSRYINKGGDLHNKSGLYNEIATVTICLSMYSCGHKPDHFWECTKGLSTVCWYYF